MILNQKVQTNNCKHQSAKSRKYKKTKQKLSMDDKENDLAEYTDEDFEIEQFWEVENSVYDLLSNNVNDEDYKKYVNKEE